MYLTFKFANNLSNFEFMYDSDLRGLIRIYNQFSRMIDSESEIFNKLPSSFTKSFGRFWWKKTDTSNFPTFSILSDGRRMINKEYK